MLPTFAIEISSFEEPGTREGYVEFEARLLADGEDWLGDEYMGLDPLRLKQELSKGVCSHVVVGRCLCGCEGCSDKVVEVARNGSKVVWSFYEDILVEFDAFQYDAEVKRFLRDKSWEPMTRTAERLIGDVLKGSCISEGYVFNWASVRSPERMIVLAFWKLHEQKMIELDWDGQSIENAIELVKRFQGDQCI